MASLITKRKTTASGGVSTQPISTGGGAAGTKATRPPIPKSPGRAPVAGPREQPNRRYDPNKAAKPAAKLQAKALSTVAKAKERPPVAGTSTARPSPRAMERANANASFKRKASGGIGEPITVTKERGAAARNAAKTAGKPGIGGRRRQRPNGQAIRAKMRGIGKFAKLMAGRAKATGGTPAVKRRPGPPKVAK